MILVTVGTTDFDAVVARMDGIAAELDEEVVAQIGRGDYLPEHMESFRFAPSLTPWLDRARLVVSHGGLGTVVEVLERGIPLVAIGNPDRFDRHQDDLLAALERRGHLVWCRTLDDLELALRRADTVSMTPYASPGCRIAQVIRRHLGLDPAPPEPPPATDPDGAGYAPPDPDSSTSSSG